jgi:hypothetical protein
MAGDDPATAIPDGGGKFNILITMTEYLVKRTGKLLFPHLARDQRNQQLLIILLVLVSSLSAAGGLAMWMMSGRH